jgi:hypothetical protein
MTRTAFLGAPGSIYVITNDGDLLWYGDVHRDGTPGWAHNSGNRIGSGWQDVRIAFGGASGSIYAVKNDGALLWFGDAHRDGTPGWAANSGNQIGSGWKGMRLAFEGGDGIIYAVDNDGGLHWYRDVPRNGTPGWAANSGNQIGSGWQQVRIAFGGGDGIIYAIKENGDLLWFRDVPRNGTVGWEPNSGNQIGSGWETFPGAFGGVDGIIYGIDAVGSLRWYRDQSRNGIAGWAARSGNVIGSGWVDVEWSPRLGEFGHGAIMQGGRPALGPRRLLIVLAEYDNDANNRCPPFSTLHPLEYYERLGFGDQRPPFSTTQPVNPASLTGYVQEASLGRFWFTRAGLAGPFSMGPLVDPGHPELRAHRILARLGAESPQILFDADEDGNHLVSSGELVVLIVENIRDLQPANRDNLPLDIRMTVGPVTVHKTVQLHVAFAGPLTPFYQIAHETMHSLGTVDMYNSGAGNFLLTVMGGYSFDANDQGIVHLDAWHKLALGWCEPRRRRLTRSGDELLVETSIDRPNAALILWHPARGTREFFMLERRRAIGTDRKYESTFPGDGVLLWRITPGAPHTATHLGSPLLGVGENRVWAAGQTTPLLPWSDGSSTDVALTFAATASGAIRVTWQ